MKRQAYLFFFKTHREEYYGHLQRIRTEGAWEDWLRFFLEGVQVTSKQAVETAKKILTLFEKHCSQIEQQTGRAAGSVLRVHDVLKKRPLLSIGHAARLINLARPTVASALDRMEELGIIREITGQERNRVYTIGICVSLVKAPLHLHGNQGQPTHRIKSIVRLKHEY